MKIRSKALFTYLLEAGVLNGTPELVAYAKQAYRKQYKRNWKQQKRPRKEIRIEFSLKQFATIKLKAQECEMKHTTYARSVILEAVELQHFITRKDELLKTLQLVSMAVIATEKHTLPLCEVSALLTQAETILLDYLNTHAY